MTTLAELVIADCGNRHTHLVVHADKVIESCGILHSFNHRCDVADNWVLVRPGLHSSADA